MSLFGPPDVEKLKRDRNTKGLIKALDFFKKNSSVAQNAAKALGELGDPQAIEALDAALHSEAWYFSYDILINALIAINEPQYFRKPETVNMLINLLQNRSGVDLIIAVIKGLEISNDQRAVAPLINELGNKENNIKLAATKTLAAIGDPEAAKALANVLEKEYWTVLEEAACEGLSKMGERAVEALIPILNTEHIFKRKIAMETLAKIGPPAVPALLDMLKQKDLFLKIAGCEALGKIGDNQAFEPMMTILKNIKTDRRLRNVAAKGLVHLGWELRTGEPEAWFWAAKRGWEKMIPFGADAVEPLLASLLVETEDESKNAFAALVRVGDEAVDPLIRALEDKEYNVRQIAAMALGEIGNLLAIEPLQTAFKKDGWDINDQYGQALKKLGAQLPKSQELDLEDEKLVISTLNKLCAAYASSNHKVIKELEPKARKIGEEANLRGGMMEMRRLYHELTKSSGLRNLEFLWGGIGHWRG